MDQYSRIDEIILAPGSVFELKEVTTDANQVTTIQVKLKNEIKSLAYKGFIMQGALQNEMMTDRVMKIMCLEGEELNEALKAIEGNKLIEEVEFCLCKFDHRTYEKMTKKLLTMERTKKLKFVSCWCEGQGEMWKEGGEMWEISRIEISGRSDFYQVFFGAASGQNFEYWKSLRELSLDYTSLIKITDKGQKDFCFKRLKYLTQLTSLNLNFSWCP